MWCSWERGRGLGAGLGAGAGHEGGGGDWEGRSQEGPLWETHEEQRGGVGPPFLPLVEG